MKTILMSIHPKWCEKIFNGEKTIEVRKTAPKPPFKVYVYCTYGRGKGKSALYIDAYGKVSRKANGVKLINGKVIGEFVCDKVNKIARGYSGYQIQDKDIAYTNDVARASCLDFHDVDDYLKGKNGYAWHISDLKIYDEPKELGEFYKPCIMPEMPYCPACKYGNVQYSPDEVECASDLEGASCEWLCLNSVKRPPQSWRYIEEIH